jgi:hypothetical protein
MSFGFRGLTLLLGAATVMAGSSSMTFPTPELAANALLTAIETDNLPLFLSIAGNRMAEFWGIDDAERGVIERHHFIDVARRRGFNMDSQSADRKVLYIGNHSQSFPAPLVNTGSGWRFDDAAGVVELAARRIHRNEVGAIESCKRFRDAQIALVETKNDFVRKIRSTPGTHDGLVSSDTGEEDWSPMGPDFADAAFAEEEPFRKPRPLLGYYFKIVPDSLPDGQDQTNHASAPGAALIAWPADYGVDGIRTFVINHLGELYQKDLGPGTALAVRDMAGFIPDSSWGGVEIE